MDHSVISLHSDWSKLDLQHRQTGNLNAEIHDMTVPNEKHQMKPGHLPRGGHELQVGGFKLSVALGSLQRRKSLKDSESTLQS